MLPHIEGEHCEGLVSSSGDETRAAAARDRASVTATVDRMQRTIRVAWTGLSGEPVQCSAYSMLGELLYRTTMAPGATSTTIAQSSLIPGLVLVSIETPSSPPAVTVVVN